jgi:hypothetical protein
VPDFDPLALDSLVDSIHDCACSALTATAEQVDGQPGCPCLSCKVPGAPRWDCRAATGDDCAAGQLTVRVTRLFPSIDFPRQDSTSSGCEPATIVAEVAVLLLRCMPLHAPNDEACPPTCDQLAEAARIQHVDMLTLFRMANCCVAAIERGSRRRTRTVIQSHRAVGGEAGTSAECVGSELVLLVDVGNPCGCTDELPTPDPSA